MALNFNRVQPAAPQPVEQKPVEKKLEAADELKAYINTFLEDGMFDESEAVLIFQKAAELNISEDEAMDLPFGDVFSKCSSAGGIWPLSYL